MTANIIDGKKTADLIQQEIKKQIQLRTKMGKRAPGLAVILVGNDAASQIYVGKKRQTCEKVGIKSFAYDLPKSTTQNELLSLLKELNIHPEIDGILVQMPLPKHIDANAVIDAIAPNKDVDGFHPYNIGCLVQKRPSLRPCTPFGIMTLFKHYQIEVKRKNAVVVGASTIVGRPMSLELLLAGATVTTCHRFTQSLEQHIALAEVLIVAIGKRQIIKSEWIKPGAVVIDVGIHRLTDGSICGDIDFESAKERAGWITPVPGGVGPMTVATLLQNTLLAAEILDNNLPKSI